jgi:hypothetical protein
MRGELRVSLHTTHTHDHTRPHTTHDTRHTTHDTHTREEFLGEAYLRGRETDTRGELQQAVGLVNGQPPTFGLFQQFVRFLLIILHAVEFLCLVGLVSKG